MNEPDLDISRHVERPDGGEPQTALVARGEELAASARVGPPRIRVVKIGGEEVPAAAGLSAAWSARQMGSGPRAGGEVASLLFFALELTHIMREAGGS